MMDMSESFPAAATGWLRTEGLVVAAGAVTFYAALGAAGWILFALLFFLPDVSFAGYLAGPRVGAVVYNVAHTYTTALIPLVAGWLADSPLAVAVGLIWIAHIGFDRLLGYGLKLPAGFRHTHLGMIGGGLGGTRTDSVDGQKA